MCMEWQAPRARRFNIDEETRATWTTVPIELQSYVGTIECTKLESICPQTKDILTMDGASKCWQCVHPDDKKLLVGSTDAECMCYVGENSGYMDPHIMVCVYVLYAWYCGI
jgi:hypothetical protein